MCLVIINLITCTQKIASTYELVQRVAYSSCYQARAIQYRLDGIHDLHTLFHTFYWIKCVQIVL